SGTDTRSVPVRYTDGTNIVTVSPTLTITINPCNPDLLVSAAFTATPFFNTGGIGVTGAVFNQSQNINPGDLATLRFGQTNANRGIVWQQLHIAPATTLSELRRSGTSHASFQSDVLMTNWMSNMVGKQIFDIEVDSTNRVLFANTISSTVHNAPPSSVYNATTGADFGIRYFDYAGVAVPWTSVQTITTTAKPIALALDLNDDVLMIDITNVLHKYSKATGYTEVTTGGWPVDLKLAPYNLGLGGAGAGDKKVHDFIVDWRTRSIIILAQSQESATAAPGNGYLLRINCDLSVPTLPNGNPVRLLLTDSTSQALNADITIDQLDANGIALNSLQGSRQIAVLGNTNSTTVPDFYFYDTNLFLQGSMQGEGPNGTIKGSAATFNIHNNLTHTWDGSTNIAWQLWYRHGTGSVSTGNPPGWQ
ncbi:MAG TPA: hypothetical protein VEI97_07560, partial [bacterium]|nr:hypothetical protein [bacterium]